MNEIEDSEDRQGLDSTWRALARLRHERIVLALVNMSYSDTVMHCTFNLSDGSSAAMVKMFHHADKCEFLFKKVGRQKKSSLMSLRRDRRCNQYIRTIHTLYNSTAIIAALIVSPPLSSEYRQS